MCTTFFSHTHTSQIFTCHENFKYVTISGLSPLWYLILARRCYRQLLKQGCPGDGWVWPGISVEGSVGIITPIFRRKLFPPSLYPSALLKALKDTSTISSLKSQNYCVPVSFVMFSFLFSALWWVYLTLRGWLLGCLAAFCLRPNHSEQQHFFCYYFSRNLWKST